jgi:hypothetical protein
MNFDTPELVGGGALGALMLALRLALAWVERGNRKRMEAAKSVPPSPSHSVPPPAADRALLARLDRAEQHDALVAALFKGQAELVDTQRKLDVLREENYRLAVRDRAKDDEIARLRLKLKADEMAIGVLREQLSHVEQERDTAVSEKECLAADLRRALLVKPPG